jgi:hypothetical protein
MTMAEAGESNVPRRLLSSTAAEVSAMKGSRVQEHCCKPASRQGISLRRYYGRYTELFFRWFKCILGCQHLLSTCQNGVKIQVYLALIASLLVVQWTGHKPTKRTFEMLCLYFQGWASERELVAHIRGLNEKKTKKS